MGSAVSRHTNARVRFVNAVLVRVSREVRERSERTFRAFNGIVANTFREEFFQFQKHFS
jgi:hypothetical protein